MTIPLPEWRGFGGGDRCPPFAPGGFDRSTLTQHAHPSAAPGPSATTERTP